MIHQFISKCLGAALVASLWMMPLQLVQAGPGAHGPNGEHLDSPQKVAGGSLQSSPRIEAKSDLFELIGTLGGGEFSILIDRFATNEPLLRAQVEVESDGVKAQAKFHDDIGDYVVDDPVMLRKLSTPGEHPVVITVLAGQDTDLLDAVLRVEATADDGDHHIHWEWWGLGGLILLVLLVFAAHRLRTKRHPRFLQGGQA